MKDPLYASVFNIKAALEELKQAVLNGVDSSD